MRAALALLADRETHNLVRKLTWQAHRMARTGTIDVRLPPHVSLKLSFAVDDLDAMEAYADELALSIQPVPIHLTELQVRTIEHNREQFGLLWIDVEVTSQLRILHDRLNRDLAQRFGETQALYDGPEYHFHMTVAIGEQPPHVYEQLLDALPNVRIERMFTARELGLFVYDEPFGPHGEYLTYKIIRLTD